MRKMLIEKSGAANGLERHVGIHLFSAPNEKKLASAYISANILITLFLTLLCGFLSRSAVAAALRSCRCRSLRRSWLVTTFLLCVPPRRLPRFELDGGVPDEGRTVCVISALLTDEKGGQAILPRFLEEFYLANRDCGKICSWAYLPT